MLRIKLSDRVRNIDIRKRTKVEDIITRIAKLKWQYAGHVARPNDDRWTRRLLEWRPRNYKRSAGRPPTRWQDDIKKIESQWMSVARDRKRWKCKGEAYVQQWSTIAG